MHKLCLVFFTALSIGCTQERPKALARIEWPVLENQARVRVDATCPLETLPEDTPGRVIVRLRISTEGKVLDASAYAGYKPLFGSATDALSKWQFAPQTVNGEPAEVQTLAEIEVCKETPRVVSSSVEEFKGLIDRCADETNEEAEASCKQAKSVLQGMPQQEAVGGHWIGGAVIGDFYLRKGNAKEAEKIYRESLDFLKAAKDTDGFQIGFLWKLGQLYESQDRFEEALGHYEDAEKIVQSSMDSTDRGRKDVPESVYESMHHRQLEHMRRALGGQIRALTGLKKSAEADAIRVKMAKLK